MPPRTKKATAAAAAPSSQPSSSTAADAAEDVSMTDAQVDAADAEDAMEEDAEGEEDEEMAGADDNGFVFPEKQNIRLLPGSTDTAASFEFVEEDHTLGNALRWIIMKNPDVEFCGYSIPHPSEPKMNIRIQTYEGTTATEALEKGFDDLIDLCDVVEDKFAAARHEFTGSRETST